MTLAFRFISFASEGARLYRLSQRPLPDQEERKQELAARASQAGLIALIAIETAMLTKGSSKAACFICVIGQLLLAPVSLLCETPDEQYKEIVAGEKGTDEEAMKQISMRFFTRSFRLFTQIGKFYSTQQLYMNERFLGLDPVDWDLASRVFTILDTAGDLV